MTLEEIVNNLKSAGQDYGQLFNNKPRMDATKQFGGRAINNINSAGEGYSQWQRLQDQNFGPNQSVIASGFMHPQKGLSKLADWFTNNVNTAAGLPDPNQQDEASMYAYGPNIDPKNIRSRFAAFDPLRKNSSSLLASGLLGSLLLKQMNQESSQQ